METIARNKKINPDRYQAKNPERVFKFLDENLFLWPLLDLTYNAIQAYFPASPLFLEVVDDPEAPEKTQLVLSIKPRVTLEEAFTKLNMLDRSWWLDNSPLAQGKLLITLEPY